MSRLMPDFAVRLIETDRVFAASLGMPADAELVALAPESAEAFGARFREFTVDNFGLVMGGDELGDWPALVLHHPDGPDRLIQIWRRVVRHGGRRAFLEMWWTPTLGRQVSMLALEDEPEAAARALAPGIALLRLYILSAVVRRAWDNGDLRTLTRHSPVTATGAHVVIITRDELLRHLDGTELASGFMNRFLVCAARRSRVLPDGEGVPLNLLELLADELRAVMTWAREPRVLRRDAGASRIWHGLYEALSAGQPGIFGAATNRTEAQVLRLSVLYAVLDRSDAIKSEHVMAALAVWQYASNSARWVFGDAVGDPEADAIMSALRSRGSLTRTDIRDLFGRHVEKSRIERALVTLEGLGRVLLALLRGGVVTAAKLAAEAGDVRRFRSSDAFAALAGVAPIPGQFGPDQAHAPGAGQWPPQIRQSTDGIAAALHL